MRLIDADALIEFCTERWIPLNIDAVNMQPTIQPERDIPVKPNETTDTTWGIPRRQAVCPKCDCYLVDVLFLVNRKDRKVTYCDTCGQAIDWEGWDSDG